MAKIELQTAVPVLPVKDLKAALSFYSDKLGFQQLFEQGPYAGVGRGPIEIHLDAATAGATPVTFRINMTGVDAIHAEIDPKGVVDPKEQLETKPWGLRQFSAVDPFGNRIVFAEQMAR
jgi:uncharacterized glyoxalase superfamily protein PhnB